MEPSHNSHSIHASKDRGHAAPERRGITPELYHASNPAGLAVSQLRWIACSLKVLKLWSIVLVLGGLAGLLFWKVAWWAALLPLAVGGFMGAAFIAGFKSVRRVYRMGDLVAAMVTSRSPFRIVALTDLRKDMRLPPTHALLLKEYPCPWVFSPPPGSRLACAAVYFGGSDGDPTWHSFHPLPLFMATWSRRKIAARQALIDERDYELIEQAMRDGMIPGEPEEVLILEHEYAEAVLNPSEMQ